MIYSVICMRKDEIMEILQDWNFWKKELDTGRYRPDYIDKCRNFLKTNVIIAIIGVRRSCKSYIMRQLMNKISENTEKKNILMINFEDRRFAEFYSKILDEIYDAYLEFLKPDKNVFVFLDEIHNVPKWEKWVRTMHEHQGAFLSKHLTTLLTVILMTTRKLLFLLFLIHALLSPTSPILARCESHPEKQKHFCRALKIPNMHRRFRQEFSSRILQIFYPQN